MEHICRVTLFFVKRLPSFLRLFYIQSCPLLRGLSSLGVSSEVPLQTLISQFMYVLCDLADLVGICFSHRHNCFLAYTLYIGSSCLKICWICYGFHVHKRICIQFFMLSCT